MYDNINDKMKQSTKKKGRTNNEQKHSNKRANNGNIT